MIGVAFRPDMLPGLQLWLDGAAVPGTDADLIATWANRSPRGSASDGVQAVANHKPELLNQSRSQGGHSVLNFVTGGAGDEKYMTGDIGSTVTDAITIMYVAREVNEQSYETVLSSGDNGQTTGIWWLQFLSAGVAAGMGAGGGSGNVLFEPPASGPDTSKLLFQSYRLSGGTWTLAGVKTFSIADASTASGTYHYNVGISSVAGAVNPSQCWIAEILIWNRSISAAEHANVLQYLTTKWSLT